MAPGRGKIPTCKGITDVPLRRACEEAFDACKKLPSDGSQVSCAFQATRCIDNYQKGAESYPFEMPNGISISYSSANSCFSASMLITKAAGPLPRFRGMAITPSSGDAEIKSHSSPPASPRREETKKTPAQPAALEICDKYSGPKNSAQHNSCLEQIGICTSGGPFGLPFQGITMSFPDSQSCLRGAFILLNIPYSALPETGNTPDRVRPSDESGHAASFSTDGNSWQPDGKTRFEVAFDYTNFAPETGSDNESETTLLARYGDRTKKLDVKIRYSLEETGSGQYRMKYTILGKGEGMLNGERTIEFEARDGKITDNLVFAITLGNEGDFSTASSVEIIKK